MLSVVVTCPDNHADGRSLGLELLNDASETDRVPVAAGGP